MEWDRVYEVARMALLHDEIMSMPMGYRTIVTDMGSILSGGQKQRVLIARALYRNPKILMLDEGTANLDVAREDAFADILASLEITRIVVAHRPALLKRADRVFEVGGGSVQPVLMRAA